MAIHPSPHPGRSSLVTLVAAGLLGCWPGGSALAAPQDGGREITPQIIGGDDVGDGEADAFDQVRIDDPDPDYRLCSGTRIGLGWVLTARHCISPGTVQNPRQLKLWRGNRTSGHVVAQQIVFHPNNQIDIAMVRLSSPFGGQDSVQDVLWYTSPGTLVGKTLRCYGYGRRTPTLTGDLRRAYLTVGGTWDRGYTLQRNARGQVIARGDSGGACFLEENGYRYITGVHVSVSNDLTQSYDVDASRIRGFVTNAAFRGPFPVGNLLKSGMATAKSADATEDALVMTSVYEWVSVRLRVSDGAHDWGDQIVLDGPQGRAVSDPAVVYRVGEPSRTLDVFVKGPDEAIWRRSRYSDAWDSGWSSLGGVCGSGPGAAAGTWAGRVDVFCVDPYGDVWQQTHEDGSGWSGWTGFLGSPPPGAWMGSPPSAVWRSNKLYVFVMGFDSAIWVKHWNGGSWEDWRNLGGVFLFGPTVASFTPSPDAPHLFLYGVGLDNRVWTKMWAEDWWSDWEQIDKGIGFVSRVAALKSGGALIELYGRSIADDSVYRLVRN